MQRSKSKIFQAKFHTIIANQALKCINILSIEQGLIAGVEYVAMCQVIFTSSAVNKISSTRMEENYPVISKGIHKESQSSVQILRLSWIFSSQIYFKCGAAGHSVPGVPAKRALDNAKILMAGYWQLQSDWGMSHRNVSE